MPTTNHTDSNATACQFSNPFGRVTCGSTTTHYKVSGRVASQKCGGCGRRVALDVTIDMQRKTWTLPELRAWWERVYG